ncbi:MAG: TrkA family potassium uptake protein [Anaerolineae bacterium]|nr:TrkA family potassium uptake protein [Anaerolineae bacterium]
MALQAKARMNVVVVGYSTFSWELVAQLKGQVSGRLYYLLSDPDLAMEASLQENVVVVRGDITDTDMLDQLDLAHCHTFVAGSREDQVNVLSALYARNQGAQHVYARVFEIKFGALLESVGVIPIQTSHTAAASMALTILKPAVAGLVSLTGGQFDLEEIRAADYAELVGCRLGNLQAEQLHIIAVAKGEEILLSYNTLVEAESKLIIMYNKKIRRHLHQELQQVATQAARRFKQEPR